MPDNPPRSRPRRADWAALEKYETVRALDGYRDPRLPEDPGTVHALRWWPKFSGIDYFRGNPVHAECGRPVRVRLEVEMNPDDPDACEKCAAILRGEEPRPRRGGTFEACPRDVMPDGPGGGIVSCTHRYGHEGPHRGARGDTWERGPDDYTPPPDGYV